MPRPKRPSRDRRADLLSPEMRRYLRSGCSIFGEIEGKPEAEIRAAWQEAGHEITAAHVAEHPGSRPFGWWRFESRERRRCISHPVHPFDDPARQARIERIARTPGTIPDYAERCRMLYYGMPASWFGEDFDCVFETQVDYLQRLGLLLPGEAAARGAMPEDDDSE